MSAALLIVAAVLILAGMVEDRDELFWLAACCLSLAAGLAA